MPAPFEVRLAIPRPSVPLVDKDGTANAEWRKQFFEPLIQALSYQGEDAIYILNTVKLESGDDVSELVNDVSYLIPTDNVSLLSNDADYVAQGENVSVFTNDVGYLTALDPEAIQDVVGAMFSSNTEVRIALTYDDGNGKINATVENDLSVYDNSTSGFITNSTASLSTSRITSGTFADARISESSVTQHEAALTIGQSQVTGLTTALSGKVDTTTIASLTVSASSGTLPTPDGSVTIADAASPTVSELLEYCTELEAKLDAVLSALA